MSELGEGDCAVQCWICPKCNDDHAQNGECKTLDLWWVYSNLTHYREQMEQDKPELNRRIRKLIDLVRKKDKILELIETNDDAYRPGYSPELYARNALAFTEQLK